jgi:hypothetical protein
MQLWIGRSMDAQKIVYEWSMESKNYLNMRSLRFVGIAMAQINENDHQRPLNLLLVVYE